MPTRVKDDAFDDGVGYQVTLRKPNGTVCFLHGMDDDGRNMLIGVVWRFDLGEIDGQWNRANVSSRE